MVSGSVKQGVKRQQTGFTLVELLIVIVVIAILAAITLITYQGVQSRALDSTMQHDLSQVVSAIGVYKAENGNVPLQASDANLKVSNGATLTYYPGGASSPHYCAQVVNASNTIAYFATDDQQVPTSGKCTVSMGLVGWWRLNDTGTTAVDSSSSGDDGTISGASSTMGESGKANGAFDFNGSSDIITIPAPQPSSFGAFTVEAWVNSTTLPDGGYSYVVIMDIANTIGASVYWIGQNSSGAYAATVNGNGSNSYGTTNQLGNDGQWHFITLTYDGSRLTTYLDGVAQTTSVPGAITNTTSGANLFIGGYNPTFRPFKGSIDDVRIYNRALNASEVAKLYASGAQ